MNKDKIEGLLAIKEHRGLAGLAVDRWLIEAIAVLLKAELDRIEKVER